MSAVLEYIRVVLYLFEWLWTVSIMSVFPSQLIRKTPDASVDQNVCLFDRQIDLSRCRFGTAWAAIAFIILTITIIWYFLELCTSIQLPYNAEVIIFSWLAFWWFIGAIVLSATISKGAGTPGRTAVVFAWMLVFMCAASAFIASRADKYRHFDENTYRGGGMDDRAPSSV